MEAQDTPTTAKVFKKAKKTPEELAQIRKANLQKAREKLDVKREETKQIVTKAKENQDEENVVKKMIPEMTAELKKYLDSQLQQSITISVPVSKPRKKVKPVVIDTDSDDSEETEEVVEQLKKVKAPRAKPQPKQPEPPQPSPQQQPTRQQSAYSLDHIEFLRRALRK